MHEMLELVLGSKYDIVTMIFVVFRLSKRMVMKDRGWCSSCICRFYG